MKNAIDDYRRIHGLTYAQLASSAGFSSRSVVFLHCSGQRRISAESAKQYSQALGIPLSQLRPDLWPPNLTATLTTPPGGEGGGSGDA